jgi:hypothetical protein
MQVQMVVVVGVVDYPHAESGREFPDERVDKLEVPRLAERSYRLGRS